MTRSEAKSAIKRNIAKASKSGHPVKPSPTPPKVKRTVRAKS